MAIGYCPAQSCQPPGDVALFEIRPGHLVAKVDEDFSNAAHTDATNTDKMNFLNLAVHNFPLRFKPLPIERRGTPVASVQRHHVLPTLLLTQPST